MRIALLGDIALFGRMSVSEDSKVSDYYLDIADYLQRFDYVVGNLETPFSVAKRANGAKSAYICSDVQNVATLRHLHINAVCLANNHMFDFGAEGYETTKRLLTENAIDYFGAEGKELRIDRDGNKIAFSGFCCYSTNPLQCVNYNDYGVNAYNIGIAKGVLSRNNRDGYLIIMAVHAGLEHVNYPSLDHIRAARLLSDVCPYVYYGHHPHVIQGVEEYKGSIIAHSLGNFCFDDVYTDNLKEPLVALTENNRKGMILELTIENNQIIDWREQIIYIDKNSLLKLVDADDDVKEYNSQLKSCEENADGYIAMRQRILRDRIKERKSKRNFSWYLKRLRPRYVQLILDMRKNSRLYKENVCKYLS